MALCLRARQRSPEIACSKAQPGAFWLTDGLTRTGRVPILPAVLDAGFGAGEDLDSFFGSGVQTRQSECNSKLAVEFGVLCERSLGNCSLKLSDTCF